MERLERLLAAKVDERERAEIAMRETLENIRDLNLMSSRRVLEARCAKWLALQAECIELGRQLCGEVAA